MSTADGIEVAERFAHHLLSGNYRAARGMLSAQLQSEYSDRKLWFKYSLMFLPMRLFGGAPSAAETVESMDDWPSRLPGDVAWVYVSIHGANAGEAVAVVVTREMSTLVIRSIEWGRP